MFCLCQTIPRAFLSSESFGSERIGQKFFERRAHHRAVGSDEHDGRVGAELAQHLQAFAFNRVDSAGIVNGDDEVDVAVKSSRAGGAHRDSLSQCRTAVRGVVVGDAFEDPLSALSIFADEERCPRAFRVRHVRALLDGIDAPDELLLFQGQLCEADACASSRWKKITDQRFANGALAVDDIEQERVATELHQHLPAESAW